MNPGPCCLCGARNYAMSLGGPTICPSCDCGNPPKRETSLWPTLMVGTEEALKEALMQALQDRDRWRQLASDALDTADQIRSGISDEWSTGKIAALRRRGDKMMGR